MIEGWLSALQSIETQVTTTGFSIAGLKKADEIEWYPGGGGANGSQKTLQDWGRMYVSRISVALGVPIYSDVFGKTGYLGDRYSAGGLGMPNAGRGLIPLG